DIAWQLGINPDDHRFFLNQFFTGRFEGSFARGVAFQENKENGDCRVAGQLASLAGLEKALQEQNDDEIGAAIDRILLLHAIIFSIGGVPLMYIGDELGLLNDYTYEQNVDKLNDSRWVNRVPIGDRELALRNEPGIPNGRVYAGIQHLLKKRKSLPILGNSHTHIVETDNPHVFAFIRYQDSDRLLVLGNFSEHPQAVTEEFITGSFTQEPLMDSLTSQPIDHTEGRVHLAPYQAMWLQSA
ncbi:MAG: alpha-glucosidase C-terminal domain-containing protein, partial [Natronospirillum sp.]